MKRECIEQIHASKLRYADMSHEKEHQPQSLCINIEALHPYQL